VEVSGTGTVLTSSPVNQRIALSVRVNEGRQYRLHSIQFKKNGKAIHNARDLRSLIPMADGDVFSREKITGGLENIRRAYGAVGYINFVAVPDTSFDDENSLVDLDIDIDEGKQFHLASISFLGLDEAARRGDTSGSGAAAGPGV